MYVVQLKHSLGMYVQLEGTLQPLYAMVMLHVMAVHEHQLQLLVKGIMVIIF